LDDPALRSGVGLIDRASRQSEMRARLVRQIVLMVLTGQADSRSGLQEVAALRERSIGYDADLAAGTAGGRYAGLADGVFSDPQVQRFNSQVTQFLATGDVDLSGLLDSVRAAPDRGYAGLRNQTAEVLLAEADRAVAEAEERRRLMAGLAALVVLVALVVSWAAARSITRPLRSLSEQAEAMATEGLPAAVGEILDTPLGQDVAIPEVAPVTVRTRDEVREVAAALTTVQRSALDLAFEQAVLRRNIADSFVNLGRRNQNLLNRQLDFITDLERDETDPDTLAGLFKLDHLATRMRRNAESLLVLAGVEQPRQWSAPVPASDVVRAALGEVEDYQRVLVRHLEPACVTGAVAADLAHVLAELVENALAFSPAEEPVEIKGRLAGDGYAFAVIDNGMGMSGAELVRANRRLAGGESFTVAPSRYLGHYVAGHLARRIGVNIELTAGPAGGTTARVDVPIALIADEELTTTIPLPPATQAGNDREPPFDPEETQPVAEEDEARPTPPVEEEVEQEPMADAGADAVGFGGVAGAGAALLLPRRVPGKHFADRWAAPAPRAAPAPPAGAVPPPPTPEDVYSFLSEFQSGVERGLADSQRPGEEEPR
jgi:signal transduction histidine kinase